MNKDIIGKIFPEAINKIEAGLCPTCGKPIKIEEFVDELSVKEFEISGMCMACQRKAFTSDSFYDDED